MQERIHTSLVSDALVMALEARRPSSGLLHHSDRGSQYASGSYQDHLQQHGITCSMCRTGNCWDNAVVESFFSTLKWELLSDQPVGSLSEVRSSVFEYIEVWYNRKRRHSTLGYVSPAQFEQSHCEQNDPLAIAAQTECPQLRGKIKSLLQCITPSTFFTSFQYTRTLYHHSMRLASIGSRALDTLCLEWCNSV